MTSKTLAPISFLLDNHTSIFPETCCISATGCSIIISLEEQCSCFEVFAFV